MKKIIAVVIAVIVIVLALLFWKPSASPAPAPEILNQQATAVDDTASIDEDLQTIEIENLDEDFSDLDKDIESL